MQHLHLAYLKKVSPSKKIIRDYKCLTFLILEIAHVILHMSSG